MCLPCPTLLFVVALYGLYLCSVPFRDRETKRTFSTTLSQTKVVHCLLLATSWYYSVVLMFIGGPGSAWGRTQKESSTHALKAKYVNSSIMTRTHSLCVILSCVWSLCALIWVLQLCEHDLRYGLNCKQCSHLDACALQSQPFMSVKRKRKCTMLYS